MISVIHFGFFLFTGSSPCSSGSSDCSHLCLLRPGGYTCACPYGMQLEYGSNKTCIGKWSREQTNKQTNKLKTISSKTNTDD